MVAFCTHSLVPRSFHLVYHVDGSLPVHIELPCFARCPFVGDVQIIHPVLMGFRMFPVSSGYKQGSGEHTCSQAVSHGYLFADSRNQSFVPAVYMNRPAGVGDGALRGVFKESH